MSICQAINKKKNYITDFKLLKDDFDEQMRMLLQDIFNPEIEFEQTQFEERCSFCEFKIICNREGTNF